MFSIAIIRGSQLFPHWNQRAYSNCTHYAIDESYLHHGYGILGIAVSINSRRTFIIEEINVRSNHQASFNIKVHLPHRLGRLGSVDIWKLNRYWFTSPNVGSIPVGDLYRLCYSLSWWLGFPTRWARKPRPYDRGLSANYGRALHKCQHALGWEGWKSGRTEDLLLLFPYIVIPSKQKKKAIGFFGNRNSL